MRLLMALTSTGVENPRSRATEKRKLALIWLNRWGYCTPRTLADFLQIDRSNGAKLVNQLIKKNLVREVVSGGDWGYWKYQQSSSTGKRERQGPYVLMLTEVGKATASALDNSTGAAFERQVSGVQSIRHNLLTQIYTCTLLADDTLSYINFMPEPMARNQSLSGTKQPDVVMLTKNGKRHAIEIELTPKSRTTGALDRALLSVAYALENENYELVAYVFSSKAAASAYEKIWQAGHIPVWKQVGSRWEPTKEVHSIKNIQSKAVFLVSDLLLGSLL